MARTLGDDLSKILATLAELYELQGDAQVGPLLSHADYELEQTDYDNWNGGTFTYALHLKVSPRLFAGLGDPVAPLERQLLEKLKLMTRAYSNEYLGSVIITPSLDAPTSPLGITSSLQEPVFWERGYFKLFIGHVSSEKRFVAELAQALRPYGVSGFVAHESIEPTKEWQDEIILALNTMDALVALLSPGFHESRWTDQEIGFAIGRGALVLSVRIGVDPYGFMGRFQAFTVERSEAAPMAREIVRILAAHQQTRLRMAAGIVAALESSESFAEAKARADNLALLTVLPMPLRDRLRAVVESNLQVGKAWGVPHRVASTLERFA